MVAGRALVQDIQPYHPYPHPYPSPGTPHQVEAQGQRVCPACNTACRKAPFVVPADRVRMLSELIGVWSKAREFYTRWEVERTLAL